MALRLLWWLYRRTYCKAHRQNIVVLTALVRAAAIYVTGGYQVIVGGIVRPWAHRAFLHRHPPGYPMHIHYLILHLDEVTTLHRARHRGSDAACSKLLGSGCMSPIC
ncbi:hypothetical protein [Mycobacterium leprae]|uniref:hypothetical protein n=1 Tax=Mycobacterium leprae TaxID=1769 RepID=UPI0011AEAADD|nr:hypothetical protein [Mycobacterium leprae]